MQAFGRYCSHVHAELFRDSPTGTLVPITGTDPRIGPWEHVAYVPHGLPDSTPSLSVRTFNAIARARAALDTSARQLPEPGLLRRPTLRREAQSTSALEGTYAPLEAVLAADDEGEQADAELHEVLNDVRAAGHAFAWVAEGRPLTVGLLAELEGQLVAPPSRRTSTPADCAVSRS